MAGSAFFYCQDKIKFKEVVYDNGDSYEVLVAARSLTGHSRKIVVVCCYIPPNYSTSRANGCLEYIGSIVADIKGRHKDPYIVVSGDFNQWDLGLALEEFNLRESSNGPTRGTRVIDRTFTNFEEVMEVGTLSPLQADDGQSESDHRVCYLTARLKRRAMFKWLSYKYRYNNEASAVKLGEWLAIKDWSPMDSLEGSDRKAENYQDELLWAIETFFPLISMRRRSTDPRGSTKQSRNSLNCERQFTKGLEADTANGRSSRTNLVGRSGLSTWKYQFSYDH